MSFDYDRVLAKQQQEHGSWWTSYADLFMMLSIVFLLMYVASSLRSGSAGYQQQAENKKLAQKAADLEEQIKVYNTLKDESLKKQTSTEEQQVYQKLMDHLNLLQDNAHQEKTALEKKAKENEEKEFALNQYQQLIRNIINTNILAKTQIQRRDQIIVAKDATILEKREKIAEMELVIGQNKRQINEINQQLDSQIQALQDQQHENKITKVIMEKRVAALKKNSESKIQELEQNNQGIAEKLNEVKGALTQTKEALGQTNQKLAATEEKKDRALAEVGNLKDDLAKTKAIANARKQLAAAIASQFGKSGLKGNVDAKTGEVTLDFGGEYFDTGSTALKPGMRSALDKFIPVYSKSLFADPKVAEKISSVEIVGFASSTYRGKYVNPKSVRPDDKAAIEYNLKLSFGRANSIFKHVLNQSQLSQEDRERLLPIMKVVGRGYLPEGASDAELGEGMSEAAFCQKYNCNKAQKVVVKFNMKD